MRHGRIRNLVAAGSAVVLVTGWLAAGTSAAAQRPAGPGRSLAQEELALAMGSVPPSSLTMPANGRTPAGAEAASIDALLRQRFAAVYGGDAVVDHGRVVNVYLTSSATAARSTIAATHHAWPVRYLRTGQTLASLQVLQRTISADLPLLQRHGIRLASWGPDVWTGKELLTVYRLTTSRAAFLRARYGTTRLLLEPSPAPWEIATTSRLSDKAPWNDGDFDTAPISATENDDCTTGWGVHDSSGTDFLLSAAHCWATGKTVKNYSYSLRDHGYSGGSNRTIGEVSNRDSVSKGMDVELIKAKSSPAAFTGTISKPQVIDDSGPIGSYDGDQVCEDGAFEDELCGLVINLVDQCITIGEAPPPTTREVCNEDHAYNPGGKIANGQGDSGSGVIRFSGSLADAAGIDSASSTADQVACVNYPKIPSADRACFSDLWYADMPMILKDTHNLGVTGLTLNT